MKKILFILKKRIAYGHYGFPHSSGLYNSAKFVVDMLTDAGRRAKLVEVTDNNDIDREVTLYRPSTVIIEALWVTPDKFAVLHRLHPAIHWIIRVHSNLPFLAHEGMAIGWLFDYLRHPNVSISFNSDTITQDFREMVYPSDQHKVIYLPNYYPLNRLLPSHHDPSWIRIGCFGAIRPMKNHLLQAVAAIRYANHLGHRMEFHINANRCEDGGESVLKNLRSLFANSRHRLVEHPWLTRDQFLTVVRQMNFVLAVSLSETFCITAADAVACSIPLICSSEVPWASATSIVPATSTNAIVNRLATLSSFSTWLNWRGLKNYSNKSRSIWLRADI